MNTALLVPPGCCRSLHSQQRSRQLYLPGSECRTSSRKVDLRSHFVLVLVRLRSHNSPPTPYILRWERTGRSKIGDTLEKTNCRRSRLSWFATAQQTTTTDRLAIEMLLFKNHRTSRNFQKLAAGVFRILLTQYTDFFSWRHRRSLAKHTFWGCRQRRILPTLVHTSGGRAGF